MYILSCICLSFVAIACAVGCYSRRYHDNLTQRCGLVLLGLGCIARVPAIFMAQSVNNDWFMIHGGMALIAAGTLWRYRKSLLCEAAGADPPLSAHNYRA